MQVEVSENWLTAGAIIGTLAAGAITAFLKQYSKSREDERTAVATSPKVAATAIGAAFIDSETAKDVTKICADVAALRRIAEDRDKHDEEERLLDRIEERQAARRRDEGDRA